MKLTVYFTAIILLILNINAQENKCNDDLIKLIEDFKKSDGRTTFELGYKLSKFVIKNDSLFFLCAKKDNDFFKSWLNGLKYHTFTVYNWDDDVDKVLDEAKLNKLMELMIVHCKKIKDTGKFKNNSSKLLKTLNNIKVRFID